MRNSEWRFDAEAHGLNPSSVEPYLMDFAAKLAASGYTRLSINDYAISIAHFGDWLRRKGMTVEAVDEKVLARFKTHHCYCFGIRSKKRLSGRYLKRVRRFMCHLAARGVVARAVVEEPQESQVPYLVEFRGWIHSHRGLAAQTISRNERDLSRLLPALGRDTTRYDAALIRQVICTEARVRCAATARTIANSLRAYLRFLASRGHCVPGLDHAVPTVPQWRLSALPRYLAPKEVERVIRACDLSSPVGLRDRAILLLLSRLGLRAGDIRGLRLDDINWREGTLRVSGKGRRQICLPLPQDAGNALLAYLRRARPQADFDQVFLCVNAPIRPLQPPASVSNIVHLALRRAGITNPPSKGANLLRHSAATSMLRAGATLDAISSLLRHRSSDTTAHYAKVDLTMLRQVVQPWPEGAPC
jgi:integrase/recombinase XerD